MKLRAFFVSVIICTALFTSAQVPQKFNYQAVVRNSQHEILSTQLVGFKMSVLKGSTIGEVVYSESHDITTNTIGMAELLIGDGEVISGSFSDINWGDDLYFLKMEADPAGGTSYEHLGTSQLISVPYALYSANVSSPTRKFSIQEETGHPVDSALFEVRNAEGQTVFAVYPEGSRVYVLDEQAKGVKGGFAIGGYSRKAKGITQEYMRVTPDSIRMYFDKEPTKGVKGGFAIGGYSRKAKGNTDYFNISGQSAAEVIPGENRVVWYPQRNAFLVGNVLVESADSVGENSMAAGFQSKAIGNYSEAFGHRSIARGDYSTSIGNHATAHAINSVSIGNHSRADKSSSFALGTGAIAFGENSYAIGSSGVDSAGLPTGNTMSIGEQSFALGMGSKAEGFGSFSIGTQNIASSDYSFAMGYGTQASEIFSSAMGFRTKASGKSSTAMGRNTTASAFASTALGYFTTASGPVSTAMGRKSIASGENSTAMGRTTVASGENSTAMGAQTVASEYVAVAMGRSTVASGRRAVAMGGYTTAISYNSLVIGRYNDTLTTSSRINWFGKDPLFIIGNGSSDSTRHNAMMVKKNGELYLPNVYEDAVGGTYRDLQINDSGKVGYAVSSRRYKSNITSLDDIGWLYSLRPVNFRYKDDASGTKRYGLIAEEVEEVNPLFVSYSKDGEPETVSYSQLVSPMLRALQEQQIMIEELKARIEILESN
jgi:hypothetical protein